MPDVWFWATLCLTNSFISAKKRQYQTVLYHWNLETLSPKTYGRKFCSRNERRLKNQRKSSRCTRLPAWSKNESRKTFELHSLETKLEQRLCNRKPYDGPVLTHWKILMPVGSMEQKWIKCYLILIILVTVFLPLMLIRLVSWQTFLTPCKFAILFMYDHCVITCGEELHVPLGGL